MFRSVFCCNVHIAVFTLDAGPLARCQCPEGPATDHLDTGFLSRFPCAYKQMLRWFPNIQDVTTCFSCSPSDVNVNFTRECQVLVYVFKTTATGRTPNCS